MINKEMIKDYLETYTKVDNVNIDKLIENWGKAKAKGGLFELFNNNLILEKKVDIKTEEKEVIKLPQVLNSFPSFKIFYAYCTAIDNIADVIKYCDNEEEVVFSNFLRGYVAGRSIEGIICSKDYQNLDIKYHSKKYNLTFKIEKNKKFIPYKVGKKILSKILKISKKDALIRRDFSIGLIEKGLEATKEFDKVYDCIRNHMSAKGTLCLSIHPMDYLTMSDNASGWTSCMSIMNGGSCNVGTLEILNSPCVVVAYLKSDNSDFKFCTDNNEDYVWNNKKWRCLFIVTKEEIVGIKEYPYHNEELVEAAKDFLVETANKEWEINFSHDKEKIGNFLVNTIFSTNLMYNDIRYFNPATAVVSDSLEEFIYKDIDYSGVAYDLQDGETPLEPYCDLSERYFITSLQNYVEMTEENEEEIEF